MNTKLFLSFLLCLISFQTQAETNLAHAILTGDSYRTTAAGAWDVATWEIFNGTTWEASAAPPLVSATNTIIIRHAISTSGDTQMLNLTLEAGGTLTVGHAFTVANVVVNNTAVLQLNIATVSISGNFTIESGGRMNMNSNGINGVSALWNGTENFRSGSIVEIQNWDFSTSTDSILLQATNLISSNSDGGYYFGHLIISGNAFSLLNLTQGNNTFLLCENDLTLSHINTVRLTNNAPTITIGGNVVVNSGTFQVSNTLGAPVINVLGNLTMSDGILNLNAQNGSGATVLNLKGNLDISVTEGLRSSDTKGTLSRLVFNGNTEQTISFTGSMNNNIDFFIANGAEVKLLTNFELRLANNNLIVQLGGTLNFNYFNIIGGGRFFNQAGGTLKITSADGINRKDDPNGTLGNVLCTGNNRGFNVAGNYHYIGNVSPQNTGTGLPATAGAKQIVINKDNATDIVNLTQSTIINSPGLLNIQKGIFVQPAGTKVTGTGALTVLADGAYHVFENNITVPSLTGGYTFTGNTSANSAVLALLGSGTQTLRGARIYHNLVFGGGGTKGVSADTPTINKSVTIQANTTVNASNFIFGKVETELNMQANSRLIVAAASNGQTRPSMRGGSDTSNYNLDSTSTIQFNGGAELNIRLNNGNITYANIDISGSNANLFGPNSVLNFKPGSTFTVKSGGTFRVKNVNGFSGAANTAISNTNNPTIVLEENSSILYNGTSTQTVTGNIVYKKLELARAGIKNLQSVEVDNDFILLNNCAAVNLPSGNTLTVRGNLLNQQTTPDFTIANNAYILQDNAQTTNGNTGVSKVQRASAEIKRNDITLWSSPVAGQNLLPFSPETLSNRFFNFNETTNQYVIVADPATTTMASGVGYGIRARNNLPTGITENWLGTFTGVLNNGDVSVSITKNHADQNYNLVGNPYPSAVNLLSLYNENNTVIQNKFYVYEHTLPSNIPSNVPTYTNYGIITVGTPSIYNPATRSDGTNPPDVNPFAPLLQPGQGFLVRATAAGSLVFKNSMRSNGNSAFFKPNQSLSNGFDMFRLKLQTPDNFYNQAVVGFFDGASDGLDTTDTEGFGVAPLYTMQDNKKLVIQARSLPFNDNTVLPLGFYAGTSGTHTLSVLQTEGIFQDTETVYLKDLLLNTFHNLSEAPYSFESLVGEQNNRFELYFNQPLSVLNPEKSAANLMVIAQQNQIQMQLFGSQKLESVQIFDLNGRLIYKLNQVNQNQLTIDDIRKTNSVLFVKAQDNQGMVYVKKLIF